MPEISRFFGIVVRMYYADHEPPHFHVRYSGQKALIAIRNAEHAEREPVTSGIGLGVLQILRLPSPTGSWKTCP
jgi:hypothetical protein